jgi:hypothetical protein
MGDDKRERHIFLPKAFLRHRENNDWQPHENSWIKKQTVKMHLNLYL